MEAERAVFDRYQQSAISGQRSAISHQPSAVSGQPGRCLLKADSSQLTADRSSTLESVFFLISYQNNRQNQKAFLSLLVIIAFLAFVLQSCTGFMLMKRPVDPKIAS